MPRIGDINVTPLEYADSIRKQVAKVSPSRLYTYRYIWKRDDAESLSVSVLTCRMDEHEKFRASLQNDKHVVSASAEYLSEIDCNYLLIVDNFVRNLEKKES